MANKELRRVIKLILDRISARRAQSEIEDVAGGVESKWAAVGKKIAASLAAAFAIKKIVDFGRAAVSEATEADAIWKRLKGTIDANGGSFEALNDRLQDTVKAFEDATTVGDEEFAETLTRVISLTGDVDASLENMGLVANVAAQFFNGELEPAANLVAKAMNGNTAALQRMGIHAKDAQEALDILAQRSMGAAEREARTFGGQLKQINNQWGNFKEAIGNAIIASDGAANALDIIKNALVVGIEWFDKNREAISAWVTKGVKLAIDATDLFLRATIGVTQILGGAFVTSAGYSAQAIAKLAQAYAIARDAGSWIWDKLGKNQEEDRAFTARIREQAKAIEEWGEKAQKAGEAAAVAGRDRLTKPIFSSKDFEKPSESKTPTIGTGRPRVGSGNVTKESQEIQKALAEFEKAGQRIAVLEQTLGKSFDGVGAEIDRTKKLLSELIEAGMDPASDTIQNLTRWLGHLTDASDPTNKTLQTLSNTLRQDFAVDALTGAKASEALKNEQNALTKAIQDLVGQGVDPADERLVRLSQRLREVSQEVKAQETVEKLNEALKSLNQTVQAEASVGLLSGAKASEILKTEQTALTKAVRELVELGLDPMDARLVKLRDRLREVSDAVKTTTISEDINEELKEFSNTLSNDLSLGTIEGISKLEQLKLEHKALENAIRSLIAKGIDPEDERLKKLKDRYGEVTQEIERQTFAMEVQTAAADTLAGILGAAMQGGIHEAAVAKSKQNKLEAAEMLIRAGVFALFGNFPAATKAFQLAALHTGMALAWGALAASTRGSGSSSAGLTAASSAVSGLSASGGQELSTSRQASRQSASSAVQPGAEVSIYLVGPGFHALNPEVQRVVWGASKEAEERYGPNTNVRIRALSS